MTVSFRYLFVLSYPFLVPLILFLLRRGGLLPLTIEEENWDFRFPWVLLILFWSPQGSGFAVLVLELETTKM